MGAFVTDKWRVVFLLGKYLFSVVRDRLKDGAKRLETDSDIQQVSGVEEVVEVAQHREDKVPGDVQERLKQFNTVAIIVK